MEVEGILGVLVEGEGRQFARDQEAYWVSVFGTPMRTVLVSCSPDVLPLLQLLPAVSLAQVGGGTTRSSFGTASDGLRTRRLGVSNAAATCTTGC